MVGTLVELCSTQMVCFILTMLLKLIHTIMIDGELVEKKQKLQCLEVAWRCCNQEGGGGEAREGGEEEESRERLGRKREDTIGYTRGHMW